LKNNKKYFRLLLLSTYTAILAVLLFSTCLSPLGSETDDSEWNDGKTRIVITLPGGNSNTRNLMGDPPSMVYILTFNGPGEQIIEERFGGETAAVEVKPGSWTVNVKLHDTVSSAPVEAEGEILNFTVKAGVANKPKIQMRFVRVFPMINKYLGTVSGTVVAPASLHMKLPITTANWNDLLDRINIVNKHVYLNLTFCSGSGSPSGAGMRSNGTFDPDPGRPSGKGLIASLVLPEGVTSIVNNAFAGCTNLTSIMIPDSVLDIGNSAFSTCSSLSRVYYGGSNNAAWSGININATGNVPLNGAHRYYYSATDPGTVGTHWRYVDWVPVAWGSAATNTITVQNDGNGTATATPTTASAGTLITLNAMPSIGYMFKEWQVISGSVVLLPDTLTSPATFTMPGTAVTIRAEFETVPPSTPVLSMSPITFSAIAYGDPQPVAQTVTINNTGTDTATVASIVLGGADSGSFTTLGESLITAITASGTATFAVRPNAGLNAGSYSATITVTYSGGVVLSDTAATNVSFTVNKALGAAVGTPTVDGTPTSNSITINAVTAPANGQTVEYAISTSGTVTDFTTLSWQTSLTFSGLSANTTYYIYARSVSNGNYETGTPSRSAGIPTASGVLMEMVSIPGGTFWMGSPLSEPNRQTDENQHSITVSSFSMGKYPVTQAQYTFVMSNSPSNFTGPNLPVESVTWHDAVEFCNKLSLLEMLDPVYVISGRSPPTGYPITNATVAADFSKNGYRLPTETEWEYACRGTYPNKTTEMAPRPFGSGVGTKMTHDLANFNTRRPYDLALGGEYTDATAPYVGATTAVGSYVANTYDLFDMHGNVIEWCWDWYADLYPGNGLNDYTGPGSSAYGARVTRGGSWNSQGQDTRSACRGIGLLGGSRSAQIGFRVVSRP